MSKAFRPVVETWGEPRSFSLDSFLVEQILTSIGNTASPDAQVETSDYGEVRSLWISDGRAFLDYIESATLDQLVGVCSEHEEDDDTEIRNTVLDIKTAAPGWQNQIDAQDGSLRFYIDQY